MRGSWRLKQLEVDETQRMKPQKAEERSLRSSMGLILKEQVFQFKVGEVIKLRAYCLQMGGSRGCLPGWVNRTK